MNEMEAIGAALETGMAIAFPKDRVRSRYNGSGYNPGLRDMGFDVMLERTPRTSNIKLI